MSTSPPSAVSINPSLNSNLQSISQTSTNIHDIWVSICTQSFPFPEFVQIEESHASKGTALSDDRNSFDCLVVSSCNDTLPGDSEYIPIFVVVYKDTNKETEVGWKDATTQMLNYCRDSLTGHKRIYGAVAIGTKVRLCCCSYPVTFSSIQEDIELNLEDATDIKTLEAALEVIRERGWRWAVSTQT